MLPQLESPQTPRRESIQAHDLNTRDQGVRRPDEPAAQANGLRPQLTRRTVGPTDSDQNDTSMIRVGNGAKKNCSKCGARAPDGQGFCSICGNALSPDANGPVQGPSVRGPTNETELKDLISRLSELEAKLPKSNILNKKFWPRAFAILGHNLSAFLVIYAAIFVVAMVIGIILNIIGFLTREIM